MTRRVGRAVAGVVLVVGGWWAAVAAFDVAPFFLPAPPDLVDAFARHHGYLGRAAARTLGHTLAGFTLATVAGFATAVALAASAAVRDAALPLLVALQAVPKVAVAPLMVVWLGFGPTSKITLVVLLCFFPIVISALTGLTATPAELVELARSLCASRWRTFVAIRIPYAGPHLLTGLKLGGSMALVGAVVAQITTPNAGLGAVIVRAGQAADTPLAFAAVAVLAVIGIGLFYTLVGLERVLLPWARATTG